ncbi:MAG: hypothetical protein V7664_04400 [Qipengyuania sp.]|jgi:hypothetical protein|uniref:hypothetical protein n=1 Tax=Qipengyuania sp. TaxID=2004515 RepID=UPI003001B8CF
MASTHAVFAKPMRTSRALSLLGQRGAMVGLLFASTISAAILMFGFLLNSATMIYMAIALLSTLVPVGVGVAIRREYDFFEPINLVALAIFLSTSLRSIYYVFQGSDRSQFLMMGLDFQRVAANAHHFLIGVIALSVGYTIANARVRLENLSFFREYAVDARRFRLAAVAIVAVSIVGLVLYLRAFEISWSDGLLGASRKRVHEYVTDTGDITYGVGGERYLADFAEHLLFLLSGLLLSGLQRTKFISLLAIFGVLILCAIVPFLSSSRSSLLLLAIQPLIIAHYYGKLRISAVFYAFFLAIAVIVGLGALREVNQQGNITGSSSIIDRTIGAGNGPDLVRTSAIIERVPLERDFLWGYTYTAVASIYIPRSVWPEKPPVSLGAFVKQDIFGEDVRLNGWPPGMIAEAWMNFGIYGVILIMFAFGSLLRIFYESVRPWLGISFPLTLIYSVSIWRLAFGSIGLNFALGLAQTLSYLIPIFLLIVFIRAGRRRQLTG